MGQEVQGLKSPGSRTIATPTGRFDASRWRTDFPILSQTIHGHPLAYLDSAATTQVPKAVSDAVAAFQAQDRANIHRGVHTLSQRATAAYEKVRDQLTHYLRVTDRREVIFTSGTTGAINLVAQSWGRQNLRPGDEIVLTEMEHHSNIVPWQLVAQSTGAVIKVAPIFDHGELDLDALAGMLGKKTKLVALAHVSNALGTVNPIAQICALAHQVGAKVLVDGAQAVAHLNIDLPKLGCDFYAFSAHKLYGPTGVGVLWGRRELLEAMPPYQGGGDMISSVSFSGTTYNDLPHKFEAGTPNIEGVIGLGAALDYLGKMDSAALFAHEAELLEAATQSLRQFGNIKILGEAKNKIAVVSFIMQGVHPHDIGTILDQQGVAIRAGHHCAQPLMERLGVVATARVSLGLYNTAKDLQQLLVGLNQVVEVFS